MNIIINSWPGAGATTLSVILCRLLKVKYVDVSYVHEQILDKLYGNHTDHSLLDFETKYAKEWDVLWDEYIKWKITHADGYLIDGRITGFFVDDIKNLFEIMIVADPDVRVNRAEEPNEVVITQDQITRERWFSRYQIDLFNISQIELNYDFVLNNTHLTISESIHSILDDMENHPAFEIVDFDKIRKNVPDVVSEFHEWGIAGMSKKLMDEERFLTYEQIKDDWRKYFKNTHNRLKDYLLG